MGQQQAPARKGRDTCPFSPRLTGSYHVVNGTESWLQLQRTSFNCIGELLACKPLFQNGPAASASKQRQGHVAILSSSDWQLSVVNGSERWLQLQRTSFNCIGELLAWKQLFEKGPAAGASKNRQGHVPILSTSDWQLSVVNGTESWLQLLRTSFNCIGELLAWKQLYQDGPAASASHQRQGHLPILSSSVWQLSVVNGNENWLQLQRTSFNCIGELLAWKQLFQDGPAASSSNQRQGHLPILSSSVWQLSVVNGNEKLAAAAEDLI